MRLITILTDFGTKDSFVGAMKGVIASICPKVHVVDITHEVSPQNILEGALSLKFATPYFPKGAIHLAVVDPGVGSARRAIAIETEKAVFVGPDNGLLTLAAHDQKIRRVIHLTNRNFFLEPVSRTFHGRDVFAPVAAHLARGISLSRFGKKIKDFTKLRLPAVRKRAKIIEGDIIFCDRFGNLVTNISEKILGKGNNLRLSVGRRKIFGLCESYSETRVGGLLAMLGSSGFLEISRREGSAQKALKAKAGDPVKIVL